METIRILLVPVLLGMTSLAQADQSMVEMNFPGRDGETMTVEAVLTTPATPGPQKRPALVILHHAGGWGEGTTAQYAKFFSSQGFVTLEPRMFNTNGDRQDTSRHLPTAFGSLEYLAKRPDVDDKKISLMGLSYGGVLSLYAATQWAQAKYPAGGVRYAAIAPFYPLCWVGKAYISRTIGKWRNKAFPETLMDQWGGIPMGIFAGADDDYDSKDPNACADFIAAMPDPKQKALTRATVYPGATHGWDHGRTYTFFAGTACKGTGCNNTNAPNPEITQKAMNDLLAFLRATFGP